MQTDEMIWGIINHGFCSFKAKLPMDKHVLCRNPNNATGLCTRLSCPLANAKYATIREMNGKCYLFMKTPERAHTPKHLWEKVLLPQNYMNAIKMINEQLQYWPVHMKNKCKLRLTRIHQYLIRMRRLRKETQPELVPIQQKTERRERKKEAKALKAANIEKSIEKELLDRLKQGTYGGIYNFPANVFESALKKAKSTNDDEEDFEDEEEEENEEDDDDEDDDEDEEENGVGNVEYVEGDDDEFESEDEDMEDYAGMDDDDDDDESEEDEEDEEEEDKAPKGKRKRGKKNEKETKPSKKTKTKTDSKSSSSKKPQKQVQSAPYIELEFES